MLVLTFELDMTCEGCANAARRVLSKLGDDVSDVQINIAAKRVTVTTKLPAETVLLTLKKTGRKAKLIS
ncbi:unnamed protein product [Thelazia callipaeda]|uniref:Copper transport protein ATOX1 n=1 Tax=Thelazia callipaeda TaxID=103827 RepID=A0A0N5D3T2_THECL|nr:unnamed protein product [Thelazia callipaeda]